jgi:hypothetical protein
MSVAALVSSCTSSGTPSAASASSEPRLEVLGSASIGATVPRTQPNQSYVLVLKNACTTGAPITINRVYAVGPTGGATVTSWGVGPPGGISVPLHGPVSRIPGFGHRPVTERCGEGEGGNRFVIAVARTAPAKGTLAGVWITYGSNQRLFSQIQVAITAATKSDDR